MDKNVKKFRNLIVLDVTKAEVIAVEHEVLLLLRVKNINRPFVLRDLTAAALDRLIADLQEARQVAWPEEAS